MHSISINLNKNKPKLELLISLIRSLLQMELMANQYGETSVANSGLPIDSNLICLYTDVFCNYIWIQST